VLSPLEPVPGAAQLKPNVRKTLDTSDLSRALRVIRTQYHTAVFARRANVQVACPEPSPLKFICDDALAVGRVAMTKDSAKAVVRGNVGRLAELLLTFDNIRFHPTGDICSDTPHHGR